jgi:hypothetical protein
MRVAGSVRCVMANFSLQQPRLSYAQAVLPLFRTISVGGVLVMLALLAGFAAPGPSTMARPAAPARGPLIASDQHPEWKQFLVQAAYRRADELQRLRELPSAPTVMPQPPNETPAPALPVQVADLPPPQATVVSEEDATGSIDNTITGEMTIDIGEASATELPVEKLELPLPVQRPESLRRNQSQRKVIRRPAAIRKPVPAKPEPDFLTRLFGSDSTNGTATPPR